MEAIFQNQDGGNLVTVCANRELPVCDGPIPGYCWWIFTMSNTVLIPAPGTYRFDLGVNGQSVGAERIVFRDVR